MKKLYVNAILIAALSLSAVSPVIAQQEQSSVQTKQSAFKRFKAAIADRWDISKKDAKALFTWGKKKVTWQTISQKESEAAARAFKRTGIPASIILAILAAITTKGYFSWQNKNSLQEKKNQTDSDPASTDELSDIQSKDENENYQPPIYRSNYANLQTIITNVFMDEDPELYNIETIKMLLKERPDTINRQDNNGDTALHLATDFAINEEPRIYDIITLLLKNNADTNIQNNEGETALNVAEKNNDNITINLINNYIKSNTPDNNK